jgi:hypothetical protein
MANKRVNKQVKSKRSNRSKKMRGGSLASSRVESFVKPGCGSPQIPLPDKPVGDVANVNLYQTTGGSRRKLKGGSLASDYVMKYLENPELSYENAFEGSEVKLPVQTQTQTGGKSRRTKRVKKTKGGKKSGGGSSDWVSTHNSRSWVGGTGNQPLFNQFTSEEYMSGEQILKQLESNASNVMLTGQGYASVPSLTGGSKKTKKSKKNSKKHTRKHK